MLFLVCKLLLSMPHHDWKLLVYCHGAFFPINFSSCIFSMRHLYGAANWNLFSFCFRTEKNRLLGFVFNFSYLPVSAREPNKFIMRRKLFMFLVEVDAFEIYLFFSLSLSVNLFNRSIDTISKCRMFTRESNLFATETNSNTSGCFWFIKKNPIFFSTATSKSNCIRHYIKMQRTIVDCLMKNEWTHCHLINLVDEVVQQQAMIIMEMHTQRFIRNDLFSVVFILIANRIIKLFLAALFYGKICDGRMHCDFWCTGASCVCMCVAIFICS